MKRETQVPLWDAINRYVVACGGAPHTQTVGLVAREKAVVAVEQVINEAVDAAREEGRGDD